MNLHNLPEFAFSVAQYIVDQNVNKGVLIVSRSYLNIPFKASSNIKRADELSKVILNLLHHGWLHKRFDGESNSVFYWASKKLAPGFEGPGLPDNLPAGDRAIVLTLISRLESTHGTAHTAQAR